MKYIKLFKTLADYNSFTTEDTFVMPNASYIIEELASRYTPLPPPPKVTLKYNCTEDNLYAFSNGVQNVKKLTVDGNNVDFEPLQQNNYTIDILSSSISTVDNGGYIVPEDYFILYPPTSLAIKLADATSVLDIDNVILLQLFTSPDMEYIMGMPMPLSEFIESGMLILNDNNSISFGQDLLSAIYTVVNVPGYKVTYCFADTNISLIDTVIEYEGTTGGIPLPYSFETPGQHTVELELFDGQFGAVRMFSEFPNGYDASLTSVTFNESISFIRNGTFICNNLKHITCKSKKAPILLQNTNGKTDINVPYFGTLVYPKRSDYSSWLDVNNGFGMYGWNQEPPVITCTYNVTDTTKPTQICYTLSDYNGDYFSEIKVDDVLMVNQSTEVTFTTAQEHIVTFKLKQMGIPSDAFRGCYNLTKVSISSKPNKIESYAFINCSGLTSINIPDSVTEIGEGAFTGCKGLTGELLIPDSVTVIGNGAFAGCNGLTSINIPNSITEIDAGTFQACVSLTSINIPNSVTKISGNAFYNCIGLTSIVIPDSVTEIGGSAFYNCSGLTSINIPDSVTVIGNGAFAGCKGLTSITCYATTAPSILSSTFIYVKQNGTLYVPAGSDYSSWMSTSSYYLGYYNWAIQEITTPTE